MPSEIAGDRVSCYLFVRECIVHIMVWNALLIDVMMKVNDDN